MYNWDTEEDKQKLEYQVKAYLVLEDSDKFTWGAVRDTEGNLDRKKGEGELVGNWSKSPIDGCYHISLETSIMALVDKATQRFADLAMKRREGVEPARAPKHGAPEQEAPSPAFDELRKGLKGDA